jgi:hypothetical protein
MVLQYREALALTPEMATSAPGALGISVAVLLLLGIAWTARRERPPLTWKIRAALGALVALACFAIFPRADQTLRHVGINHLRWHPSESYRLNGLLLGIALNTNTAVVVPPKDYSAPAVQAALGNPPRVIPALQDEAPTVIVVMSESFFDPTRLPKVKFLDDPTPNLRRLQPEHVSATLFSPVFGGGTANTEFEVLTGHSMRLLPEGSVPYQQYLRREHPSLARLFAAQGYETVAVHTFHRWFWERDEVYRHLGFQRFVGLEDMKGVVQDGCYPSDSVLTEQIVAQFESRRRPLFLYGISMEAHGPYQANRYEETSVRFESELDDTARAQLRTYVEAAHHADRELGELVRYFSKVETPVYIVFFGDHLPSLPRVFQQTGVIGNLDTLELQQKSFLHQVPLLVWTNAKHLPEDWGAFSTSFLGPRVLELTGTPGSRYTDFLTHVQRSLPVMVPGLVVDSDGVMSRELPAALEPLQKAWWMLQYDQLFGEQYLEKNSLSLRQRGQGRGADFVNQRPASP